LAACGCQPGLIQTRITIENRVADSGAATLITLQIALLMSKVGLFEVALSRFDENAAASLLRARVKPA